MRMKNANVGKGQINCLYRKKKETFEISNCSCIDQSMLYQIYLLFLVYLEKFPKYKNTPLQKHSNSGCARFFYIGYIFNSQTYEK